MLTSSTKILKREDEDERVVERVAKYNYDDYVENAFLH